VQTIGVAIAIPEPWGTQLQDYRASLGDATACSIPTHITLAPPVRVDGSCLSELGDHLAEAAAAVGSFEVHLRGTGTFRPVSPVVFVSLAAGISACEKLAGAVLQGPLAADLEFPYHPHVTVAHHLDDVRLDRAYDELAGFECRFEVGGFHLYTHDEQTGWRPTETFSLSGAETGLGTGHGLSAGAR